jgi:hypothetical protein
MVATTPLRRKTTSDIDERFVGGTNDGGGGARHSTPTRPNSFFDEYSVGGRGLLSSTSRLNVRTFCGIRWVCGWCQ